MDAGAFNRKITIQKAETTQDEVGNMRERWTSWKNAYAYVNGLSGKEYWEAANVQQENTVEFLIKYNRLFAKIDSKKHRILLQGKVFNIKSIDNIQFKNELLKIRAVSADG